MPLSTDLDTASQPIPSNSDPQPQSDAPSFYPTLTQESLMVEAIRRMEGKRRNQVPTPVANLQISKRVFQVCGNDWLAVSVWFDDNSDPLFNGAIVWLKGYGSDNRLGTIEDLGRQDTLAFQAATIVNHSPAFLVLLPTDEQVVVGVESINSEGVGSGVESMPTQVFQLSTT